MHTRIGHSPCSPVASSLLRVESSFQTKQEVSVGTVV